MSDEQKQKKNESNKRYRDNMSDEQKQKLKDYQKDYQKKYNAVKKLNKIINGNKIIDNDNNNDSDSISIIIKNTVPIKDINSILKINKYTSLFKRMLVIIIFLIKPSGAF